MSNMELVVSLIQRAISELFNIDLQPEVTRPDAQFGDYTTNIAMQLAGRLQRSPRQIAEQLVLRLEQSNIPEIIDYQVAGPGFINITLSDAALLNQVINFAKINSLVGKKIVIETNNPNPFKDLHIGHGYNSIVADTIANILETGGADVHRVSYHGDVGLHVGKSMWAILRYLQGDIKKLQAVAEAERPSFLSKMYAQGATAFEEDDLAKSEIEQYTKQSFALDDPFYNEVYTTCKRWSFDYFEQVFARIGSKPTERRYLERETDRVGKQIVEDNIGAVFERSDGAVIFKGEDYGLHTRVFISSRGTTLYEARDFGLMSLKGQEFNPDASYIVTAIEQKEYFNVVLKAASLCIPQYANQTHNLSTGTVKLSTGKMSSRTGDVVNIGWLFNEIEKALIARGAQSETIQGAIVGALRYTMLKNRVENDTIFDIGEAISLDGNSGPYLQYAHARACSVIRKSQLQAADTIANIQADERALLRKLSEYNDAVQKAVDELLPHHICTYLYELAQSFNRFYEHNRVIGDPREAERLLLVKSYAKQLKQGLAILGIDAPEKM